MTVSQFKPRETGPEVAKGGQPPHDGGVNERVARIEETLKSLATSAEVESVRTDVQKMDASIKTWMVATVIGLFFGFAGLFFVASNAINSQISGIKQQQAPAPQSPPIIINVPPSAAQPASYQPAPEKPKQKP